MNRFPGWYTVIRYLPFVTREEFVNVGVILVCPALKFADIRTVSKFDEKSRVQAFGHGDGVFVRHSLINLRRIVEGNFHWLLERPSEPTFDASVLGVLHQIYAANNVQLTAPRGMAVSNPQADLEEIFNAFVGHTERQPVERHLTRRRILESVEEVFKSEGLFALGLKQDYPLPLRGKPKVDLAYQNRVLHCYRAMPLEGAPRTVTDAVNAYRSVARDAQDEISGAAFTALTQIPETPSDLVTDLVAMLTDDGIQLADYRQAPAIAQDIARDLKAHDLVAQN